MSEIHFGKIGDRIYRRFQLGLVSHRNDDDRDRRGNRRKHDRNDYDNRESTSARGDELVCRKRGEGYGAVGNSARFDVVIYSA